MDLPTPLADFTSFVIQEIGALLFGVVFLFLWRQSRVIYFGLWSIAWLMRFAAAIFAFQLLRSGRSEWLLPYGACEFAFVIFLIAAARAGIASTMKDWRAARPLVFAMPVFILAVYALGRVSQVEAYQVSNAAAIAAVYFYNFISFRRSQALAGRIFRFSLFVLAAAFIEHAVIFVYLYNSGDAPRWAAYLHHESYYDFALHCVLAFAAMAMWSEMQIDRIRELNNDLDQIRRDSRRAVDLDGLTGLQNQTALARRIESGQEYPGVVAVCDMDNFKDVNDRFGHLVGDEILRNIGNLLHASIRHEDEAFRWGGDEFVILFLNQLPDIAARRMVELEGRLHEYRVRGFGSLPILISWGVADAHGRVLREAIDEADQRMYAAKRARANSAARGV
ncbi:MAG TPA: GGDEF domain-containing protein [Bryobacteraceae bacterium]|nr:GGDEF domain-containing protein [Bryobacteraceae bacterium]